MPTIGPSAPPAARPRRRLRLEAGEPTSIGILAVVYFILGRIGLELAFVHPSVTHVWMPTGLSFAAFLLLGPRVWPGVYLGAFLVNATTGQPAWASLVIAAGNTLEAVVGGTLIARFAGGVRAFESISHLARYSLLAGLASTISATIGVLTIAAGGPGLTSASWRQWSAWILGDLGGALLAAPVLVLGCRPSSIRWTLAKKFEAGLVLAAVAAVGGIIFNGWFGLIQYRDPATFFTVPVLVWAACRFSRREAAVAVFVMTMLAVVGTWRGTGPFGAQLVPTNVLSHLITYLCVISISTLALASVIEDRRKAEESLRLAQINLESQVHKRTVELSQTNQHLMQEIARRRRAQLEIQRLALIVEASNDAVIGSTVDGEIVTWNTAAQHIYGWAAEEVLGLPYLSIVPPGYHAEAESFLRRARSGEKITNFETVRMRKDGARINVSMTVFPIRAATGEIEGIALIVRDITGRIRTESELRRLEARLQTVLKISPVGFFVSNAGGDCVYVNDRCCQMAGMTPEEALGDGWLRFIHPEDRAAVREEWIRCARVGIGWKMEYRLKRSDGTRLWVLGQAAAERDPEGRLVGFVGTLTDINEQKGAAELAARAMDELVRSNRELEEFVYVASHDLQEPLRKIVNFGELLERRAPAGLDDDSRRHIRYMIEGGARMQALITDLLEYSRFKRINRRGQTCRLDEALEDALTDLKPEIEASAPEIIRGRLPAAHVERRHAAALFRHLISNAVKFAGDRRPRIEISAQRQGGFWRVDVADNGIGIDPRFHEKIFKPFQRLHSRDVPGTGIGLPICKKIVESYGGAISVAPSEGGGSRFSFTLPESKKEAA